MDDARRAQLGPWLARLAAGRTDLVFEIVESGADPETQDTGGVSLLQWCAYYGDVSAIRFLLGQGAALAGLGPNLDLNGAAFHGHWRLTAFLIEQGADPNHPHGEAQETPLHVALVRPGPRTDRVVRVLLTAGADPGAATAVGQETGCFMRDVRTRGESALHRAAAFADESTIRALLDGGASPEVRDANGDSPLTWASWHGRRAHILEALCFGPHRIHPEAARQSREAAGGPSGMSVHLLGDADPARA